ncbi:Fe-containing alcohol dehydrogenase [Mycena venus]|uniref:Fe-containing alcohol dehydrogenase n=1 Tax=Mycena venus TaxID=2733690 RepID=A0A8H6XL72_9AGAR|nr:Fe-containing alcohol dehydrogenase [Mycena venus]
MTSHQSLRPAVPPYPGPLPNSKADYADGYVFNNCDVSFGVPFPSACAKHAGETFDATRVFILSSATLANSTSALSDLKAALGAKVAGVKFGFKAHTYFSEIFETAEECRGLGVDLIVTLGGGSLTDLAKMITLVLANNVHNAVELLKLPTMVTAGTVPPAKNSTVPVICISTTLSGGEFTLGCGTTDDRDNRKHQFGFGAAIKLVILDAQLVTTTTPPLLFLQSGIRALDHCIEALSSVVRVYTPVGGSHAIGHILGPFGVVHGATSGILLPAVCKYNARHSLDAAARQAGVKAILWGVPEMRHLAESKGLIEGVADLGDLLDALVRGLGMARTLAEVGVGRNKFDKLAEFSILDPFAPTNPVPLKEKAQVMEILEMVAE